MNVPIAIRFHALEEFSRALASAPNSAELVALAVDTARVGTGAEAAELFLVEASSGQNLLVCHRGLFPEAFHQITRFNPGEGYPGLVAARREIIATDSLPQDERYLRTKVKEAGFRGYLCLPLLLGEQALGCLNIAVRHPQGITDDDREFLESIGSGLSLALAAGRWHLAETLAHLAGDARVENALERMAATVLEAVAERCCSAGGALLYAPAPDVTPQLLATCGIWQEAQLPSSGLPQGCPARLAPRFSPCPETGCPWGEEPGVCYPLRYQGEERGLLCLGFRQQEAPSVEAFTMLPEAAALLAPLLQRFQNDTLAVEQATQEERQRLAREIHDGVIQSLGLLRVKAEYLGRLTANDSASLAEGLEDMRRLAGDTVEELRRTIYSLTPADLEADGLAVSLQNLAQRMGLAYRVPVKVRTQGMNATLTPLTQLHLLRLAQEALSNALRHSGASRVELELAIKPSGCQLIIRDDGRGFDPKRAGWGMGLQTMEKRARALGGRLIIDSGPGRGTAVQIWLPPGGR